TGRPPFLADNVLDTLQKVRDEAPQAPRTLNPRLDADLETICLNCLEKEPARRYLSAEALADDLDHWLAGEVIQARRARVGVRLRKWVRRRPAQAALLLLLVLTGVFGCVGMGAWLQLHQTQADRDQAVAARRAEAGARQEAERQQRRAEGLERQAQGQL